MQERDLDTKGTKPILIQRLQEALESEEQGDDIKEENDGDKVDMDISDTENQIEDEVVKSDQSVSKSECLEVCDDGKEKDIDTSNLNPIKSDHDNDENSSKGTKRKHDEVAKDSTESERPWVVKEDEPEIDEDLVCLDWATSDLNLKIDQGWMSAAPFNRDGWGWCYAGAKATHGVNQGKVWYEARMVELMKIWVQKDEASYDLRLGWSTLDSGLMLGEGEEGWGFSTLGNKVHNSVFTEYGAKCEKTDVIGSYVDFTDEKVVFSWSKNGEDLGQAFEIQRSELKGQALFPHIISRNVKFEVNFGHDSSGAPMDNWAASNHTSTKLSLIPQSQLVKSPARISKRGDCMLVMMVGLPASGKTTWVKKFLQENHDRKFYVLSTEEFLKKMTVNGESRRLHCGNMKYGHLVQRVTRNMHDVVRMASRRRRNIIIDQTNVFEHVQRRKGRMFTGMQRKVVVVVPSDLHFEERRTEQASQEDGARGIPEAAVMEMKASMSIPKEGQDCFEEIVFAELQREDAEKVIAEYNKDAKEKGYGHKFQKEKDFSNQRAARNNGEGFRMHEGGTFDRFGMGGFNNGFSRGFEMGRGGGFGMRSGYRGGFGPGISNGFVVNRGGGFGMGFGGGPPYRASGPVNHSGGFRQGYPGSKYWGGGWSGQGF